MHPEDIEQSPGKMRYPTTRGGFGVLSDDRALCASATLPLSARQSRPPRHSADAMRLRRKKLILVSYTALSAASAVGGAIAAPS